METSVIRQIQRLRQMSVGELQIEWQKLCGEPTRSRNRDYLWKRLAWRVQELAHGGLSERAHQRIDELSPDAFVRVRTPAQCAHEADPAPEQKPPRPVRDPRLPAPGTVIVKQYKGQELRLVAHDDHFELDGHSFRSLSEAARHVTGARWNGWLFWGLKERKR